MFDKNQTKEYEDTYTHGQGTDRIDYPPERCLLCGHGGYRWNALCITDEFRL